MDFVFDIEKTVAAVGHLATVNKGRLSIFVLMKKMYGAERYALATWHRPITGDSFACMKRGPVLKRLYNLIKGEILNTNSDMAVWSKYFSPRQGNEIHLVATPDIESLSEREIHALNESSSKIDGMINENGLIADILHEEWPEWKDPAEYGKGSIPLSLEDILSEIIEDENEVERIVLEIRAVSSAKAALQIAHS